MSYQKILHSKYRSGDKVTIKGVAGRWTVHALAPGKGNYWIKPGCSQSETIASVTKYGMLISHVSQLKGKGD